MKILHVMPWYAPAWRYGGPVFAALGLTRALAQQGHDVTVMATNIDGPGVLDVPLGREVRADGVKIWYFPVETPRWWCFSGPLGSALRREVKGFDVVHIHYIFLWPTTAAALWCRKYRVPYIVRPAGSLDPTCLAKSYDRWWVSLGSRAKKWMYLTSLGRVDLGHASAVHFTSRAEMEAAGALGLRPQGFVVPLGVELAQVEEGSTPLRLRDRYPQLKGKKLVLFLSRLDPKKGLDLLVMAIADLTRRRKDVALLVAGSGTKAYERRVAALVERYGLQDRTILLGLVQGGAKLQVLREADVFVLPSYHENFGVVVVEAMAIGLPVIISNRVNICREVEQAGAGLVTDLNPKTISAAIEQLLAEDALRLEMGQRGRLLVRAQFTWENAARGMVEMYENVVRKGGYQDATSAGLKDR